MKKLFILLMLFVITISFSCYDNLLTGEDNSKPGINLSQGSTTYFSGVGNYLFGNFSVNSSSSAITFTIKNTGNSELLISGIDINNTADFSINLTETDLTIPALEITTFTITFDPIILINYSKWLSFCQHKHIFNFCIKPLMWRGARRNGY